MKYYLWNKDSKQFIVKGHVSRDMVVGVVIAAHKGTGRYPSCEDNRDWFIGNFVRISAAEVHTIVKYIQNWIA